MSLHDYLVSKWLRSCDPTFYALIMAAMREADSRNGSLLRAAWPDVWEELLARHHAPGGRLESDTERERAW